MRQSAPFQADDLTELDALLARAAAVVAMEDVFNGRTDPDVIGLRHDVDNAIEPAVRVAEWEADRGYRSTFYVLHSAPYWADKPLLRASLERIAELGHEIGIHNNAIAEALRTGRDPVVILDEAIDELREYGYPTRSVVAHGDHLCGVASFVNDELFVECARPNMGPPDRQLTLGGHALWIRPVSLARYGLEFDSIWLPRAAYLSDSGGHWSQPFAEAAAEFPPAGGQLHMLWHPDWWPEAFA